MRGDSSGSVVVGLLGVATSSCRRGSGPVVWPPWLLQDDGPSLCAVALRRWPCWCCAVCGWKSGPADEASVPEAGQKAAPEADGGFETLPPFWGILLWAVEDEGWAILGLASLDPMME